MMTTRFMPVAVNQYPSLVNHFISGKASSIRMGTSSVFVKVSRAPKVLATAFVWWAATHSGIVQHLHDREYSAS